MATKRRSYAWALQFKADDAEIPRLSSQAQRGLLYARELAEDARWRSRLALLGGSLPTPLTVAQIANEDRTSANAIHAAIKQAKLELFGRRSESAIYYFLKRRRLLPSLAERRCAGPACRELLPLGASIRRRYCKSRCRVNAHRAQHRASRAQPAALKTEGA